MKKKLIDEKENILKRIKPVIDNIITGFKCILNIMYKKLNVTNLTKKLILGISGIVFISTILIAFIFLSQYNKLALKQEEDTLVNKSYQLSEFGGMLLSYGGVMPNNNFFNSLRKITDSDFWVISRNGEVVVSTTSITDKQDIRDLNNDFIDKIKDNSSFIIYKYSSYFDSKTLTVITPIIINNHLAGAVMLHKDTSLIYSQNTTFRILIIISILISLTLSIILGIFYSKYFTKPINKITEVTKKISQRDYKIRTGIKRDDEIGELANSIDQMSEKINNNIEEIIELEKRAKDLVANVSHEFKTPLTLIRGYVENMEDKTTKPSKEIYERILTNTKILEKLVNELLDLSKFKSGKVVLKKEPLEIGQLIESTIKDMKNIASKKKIKINSVKNYKDNQIVEADYIKLRQLFTIFIDNAIKYTDNSGEVNITIDKNKITISDNGVGMEKSELDQIFERYYQVDSKNSGYGLGLCIAKYIADAHNFNINIDSKKSVGTTVEIFFNNEKR